MKSHTRDSFSMKLLTILVLLSISVTSALSSRETSFASMVQHKVFGVTRNIDIPDEIFPTQEEIKRMDEWCGPNFERGWFDSCHKGAKLHYRKWPVKNKPRAIIIFAHGIQTHSGNGMVLDDGLKIDGSLRAEAFNKAGFAVYSHDYYGHGFSEGTRWLIPSSWKKNLADYTTFVNMVAEENDSDVPIFLMGESYGSCLTIHLARQFQDKPETGPKNFDSVILSASAIDADLPPYPVRFVLRNLFAPLFPRWIPFFMPNPISADRIWRDPKILALKTEPRRVEMRLDSGGTAFRLGTAANMLDAIIELKAKAIPGFTTPFCLVHGTEDEGCPISGAKFMYDTAASKDKEFHPLEGMYHALYADRESDRPMKIAVDWVEKRLGSKQ